MIKRLKKSFCTFFPDEWIEDKFLYYFLDEWNECWRSWHHDPDQSSHICASITSHIYRSSAWICIIFICIPASCYFFNESGCRLQYLHFYDQLNILLSFSAPKYRFHGVACDLVQLFDFSDWSIHCNPSMEKI